MRKFLFFALVFACAFGVLASAASASGGKVRGDDSEGPSYQLGDCPFTG